MNVQNLNSLILKIKMMLAETKSPKPTFWFISKFMKIHSSSMTKQPCIGVLVVLMKWDYQRKKGQEKLNPKNPLKFNNRATTHEGPANFEELGPKNLSHLLRIQTRIKEKGEEKHTWSCCVYPSRTFSLTSQSLSRKSDLRSPYFFTRADRLMNERAAREERDNCTITS